jgi:hypothetical protein
MSAVLGGNLRSVEDTPKLDGLDTTAILFLREFANELDLWPLGISILYNGTVLLFANDSVGLSEARPD